MKCPDPTCGHDIEGVHDESGCHGSLPCLLGWKACGCEITEVGALRRALIDAQRAAASHLEQIRTLQDSANKRLDEYRAVTALLRAALTRLEESGASAKTDCYCNCCALLRRAEAMNLR